MSKKFSSLIFSGVFVLSVVFVFCAGYFRESITLESGRFKLGLSSDEGISKSNLAVYDIQNEGISRKPAESDKISILTGHGSTVANTGSTPIWLSVKVTGVKGSAKISSTNPIFDIKSGRCIKPLMPYESLNLNVKLDLPDEALGNYLVSKGTIEFFDYKSNKKIGEVPLKIINSKPKNSCCANKNSCK